MRKSPIVLSLVFIVAGCAGVQPPPEEPVSASALSSRRTTAERSATRVAVARRAQNDRLIKSKAKLKLQVGQPDSVHRAVIDLNDRYEGHLLYSDLHKTTIRLPQHRLFAALAEIELLGKLLDRKITGADVTEQYKAIIEQLHQLMRKRARLVAGIEQAANPSLRKELEAELDSIDTEIAQYGLKQDAEAHELHYALVTVKTAQRRKVGPLGWVLSNALTGIKKLFVLN